MTKKQEVTGKTTRTQSLSQTQVRQAQSFKKLYNNVPCGIGIFAVKGDNQVIYLNDAFFHLISSTREEFCAEKNHTFTEYFYAEDMDIYADIMHKVKKDGAVEDCEYRIVTKDGSLRWVQLNVSSIRLFSKPCYLACFMDITKVKNAELKSLHEEERYRLVMDSTNTAVFEWNIDKKFLYSSASFRNYAISAFAPATDFAEDKFAKLVYPDDLPSLKQLFVDAKAHKEKTECVLRLKMVDGSYHWCRIICLLLTNKQEKVIRVVGAIIDINSEMEKAAIQQELMSAIPGGVGVFKIGEKVQCLYYNEAMTGDKNHNRNGLQKAFAMDKFVDNIVAPEDKELFEKEVLQKAKKSLPINVTFRYLKSDNNHVGHYEWLHLNASKIREDEGVPIYYAIMAPPPQENMLYRSIVEDSLTAAMVMDKKTGTILFANQAFRQLLCRDTHGVLGGKNIKDILQPEVFRGLVEQVKSLQGETFHEYVFHTQQGKNLLSKAKNIYWNGLESCLFYVLDQTELQKRNEQLTEIMDIIPGGIGIYKLAEGKIRQVYLNDGFFRLLGASQEKLPNFSQDIHGQFIHPDDMTLFKHGIAKIKAGFASLDITYRVKNVMGNYLWIRVLGKVKREKDGTALIYCSYFDVDKQTKMRLALDNERTVLQMAMRNAKMSSWEYDAEKQCIYQDGLSQLQHGHGVVVHDVPESLIADGYVHPTSADTYRHLFRPIKKDESIIQGDVYIKTADGKGYWWARVIMTPIFDSHGKYIRSLGVSIDITEQKAIETKYEQQMQLFNAANSTNLIAKGLYNLTKNTMEHYIGETNNAVEIDKVSSYEGGLHGTADLAAMPKEKQQFLKVFDRQHLLQKFKEGVTESSYEYQRLSSDGRIFWAQTSGKLYYDPVSGDVKCFIYSYDIDEQKIAQEMIDTVVKIEYDYLALLDCRTNDYQVYSNNNRSSTPLPNFHSSSYEREVAEYAKKFLVPEEVEQNIHDMSIANIRQQLSKQECFVSYASVKNKDGSISKKKLKFSYLDRTREKVLISRVDITDVFVREQAQQQKIREANNAKTDFLSHMSHDIRTPMNTIIGLSELAQDDLADPAAMKNYVNNIRTAGKFLLGLVNDCLDFEKLAARKMTLHNVPYAYEEFRNSIMLMIGPLCKKKNITFTFTEATPYTVCIDKVRFEQIFFNLLSNSVKYTYPGGKITFIADSKLSADKKTILCDFYVRDNGIGMSEEFQKHLFEPFEQEAANGTSNQQGTGLGLSIVRELVGLMGGTIEVKSKQGVGSEFKVHLDMENVEDGQYSEADTNVSYNKELLTGKKVLLLEDQELNMVIARKLLEKQNMQVVCAANGKCGIEQFEKAPIGNFDVIITDIRMPLMSGIEVARTIRGLPRSDAKTVPIIAMTANAFEDDVQETRKAGMIGHISKPIDPETMYKEIIRCMYKKQ